MFVDVISIRLIIKSEHGVAYRYRRLAFFGCSQYTEATLRIKEFLLLFLFRVAK